jgi:hypothetical protein
VPASDYLDQRLLRWAFEGLALPAVPTVYVALYTGAPTKAGGGTEVSGGSYARLATAAADWAVSGPLWRVANARVLTFPVPTALWGTVVAFGLLDAPSGGNLLWFAALTAARTPAAAQPVVFGSGALTISGRAS